MGGIAPVVGRGGSIQPGKTYLPRFIFAKPESALYIPGGGVLDASCQDYSNPDNVLCLRAGLPVGRILVPNAVAGVKGRWSPSWIGSLPNAVGDGQTSITVSALQAAEIVRRCGATGTFVLIGAQTTNAAQAAVRELTVTYSAINVTTGVITNTAIGTGAVSGVNCVQALDVVDNTGVGTFTITIEGITTAAITYSATIATLNTAINAQLNATFGTSAIVASGASLAACILTFSGTGYAARPINGVVIPTILVGAGTFSFTPSQTTAGVVAVTATGGEFVAGSLIGVGDGSEIPMSVIGDGSGILMISGNSGPVDFPQAAYMGMIQSTQLLPAWPTDTGVQAWIRYVMGPAGGPCDFRFSDLLTPGNT
jgi:hypothetical protein